MKILIDSIYINNSGGKVLLDYLVNELEKTELKAYYLIDSRCTKDFAFLDKDRMTFLNPSVKERHNFYQKHGRDFSKVLCFANIPPTVRLHAQVYCYFHNVLLLQQPDNYPLKQKLKLKLKSFFLQLNKNKADCYIVQSSNVKQMLLKHLRLTEEKCRIIPFYNDRKAVKISGREKGFGYVSNGNPHKNHVNLLKAWGVLKERGITIPLHLTVTDAYPNILNMIAAYQAKGIMIINHGFTDIAKIYSICDYAIFPSYTESFGLGLIEAIDSGIEVIAADLPYVNAIIEPLAKFDPSSPESIADSVVKALERPKTSEMVSKSKIKNQIQDLIRLLL